MVKPNWLAVYAVCIGAWSVVANLDLAFSALWIAGLAIGLAMIVAWSQNKRIGLWLAVLAGVLIVAGVLTPGPRNPDTLAATSGACAGMLLGMFAKWILARSRKH